MRNKPCNLCFKDWSNITKLIYNQSVYNIKTKNGTERFYKVEDIYMALRKWKQEENSLESQKSKGNIPTSSE